MSRSLPIHHSSFSIHHSLPYDAFLLVSFGGPEKPEDVVPFLENVVRGKAVSRERLVEVAQRYYRFGGVSPINEQNRALLRALVAELNARGPQLAVYWGNRNWHPLLPDTVQQMADDGVRRALAFVTSAFGSYSGCRQYLEDIQRARESVGPQAPQIDKIRLFYNHPGFIEAMGAQVLVALGQIAMERRPAARLVYTAHSIPMDMAQCCPYQQQLLEACRLVSEWVGRAEWDLVYQSRSGYPGQPWLEPDVKDHLRRLHETGPVRDAVLAPIGFLCEQMELVFDLDVEAAGVCDSLGIHIVRAAAVGAHPRLVTMIRELTLERIEEHPTRLAVGTLGPSPDTCPSDCCVRDVARPPSAV